MKSSGTRKPPQLLRLLLLAGAVLILYLAIRHEIADSKVKLASTFEIKTTALPHGGNLKSVSGRIEPTESINKGPYVRTNISYRPSTRAHPI